MRKVARRVAKARARKEGVSGKIYKHRNGDSYFSQHWRELVPEYRPKHPGFDWAIPV